MNRYGLFALLASLGMGAPAFAADRYVWMEAESGAEYSPIVVKSDWAASDRIYLASWKYSSYDYRTAANGVISFEVYIPEAGEYSLWGRTRVHTTGARPYDVSVGSGDLQDASQWTRWAADNRSYYDALRWGWSHSGVSRYFDAGMHTVHLTQREGGYKVHLDKILLTNDSDYIPTGLGGAEIVPAVDNPFTANVVAKYGQLRVANGKLSDKNSQPVQLQGISAHGLQWFPIVDNQTIPYTAEYFGAEVVRLAMYVEDYAPTDPFDFWGGYMADKDAMLARTEAAIEDAVNAGIYVIVDWHIHNVPGYFTQEAVAFFSHISKKYGHLPNIIYEICNEPVAVTWSGGIKPYAESVIKAIRANDPDNIVIVGTPNWSQDVDAAAQDPLKFSNIMYALHFYAATHDFYTMKSKVETALSAGLAIFVSEWGSSDVGTSRSDYDVSKQWIDFMNQHKLSWVNWSLGNKDEASSILKPATPLTGPWSSTDLTTAGTWIKPYFDAPTALTESNVSAVSDGTQIDSAAPAPSSTTSSLVIEAEKFTSSHNVMLVDGGSAVGYFDAYDHFVHRGVTMDGVTQMVLRVASANSGGVMEIRAGGLQGLLLASFTMSSTGGFSSYQDKTINLSSTLTSVHDLYFIGKSGGGILNLDRITMVKTTTSDGTATDTSLPTVVEAERYNDSRNVMLVNGNTAVGYFDQGDYIGYRDLNVEGVNQITLRMASAVSGGVLEVRADGAQGALLTSINVASTGSYTSFQDRTFSLGQTLSGVRTLYLVGKSGSGILDVDRLTLGKGTATDTSTGSIASKLVVEAESYSRVASGSVNKIDSNQRVGYFDQGDQVVYAGVKLDGMKQVVVRMAKGNTGGTFELRAGHAYGTLLASVSPPSTGSWGTYQDVTLNLRTSLTGKHDVYLVGQSGQGIINFDSLTFIGQ